MSDKIISRRKKRKTFSTIVLSTLIIALVMAAVIIIPRYLENKKDDAVSLIRTTAVVKRGDITRSLGVSSNILPGETNEYSPAAYGEILEINAKNGDYVHTGTVIMRLSTETTDELIETMEEQVETLNEQIDSLYASIDSSYSAIEQYYENISDRNDDISDLRDDIASVRDEMAENEALRDKLSIYSPISGTIFNLQAEEGDTIGPGVILATVTDTRSYEVEMPFSVNFKDKEIHEVIIHYKNSNLAGTIVSVADFTHTDTYGNELVDVIIAFERFSALPDGATVKGTIVTDSISYKCVTGTPVQYALSVNIFPEVNGDLISVFMVEKQSVEEGDLIAVIDSSIIDDISEGFVNQITSMNDQIEQLQDLNEDASAAIDQLNEDIIEFEDAIKDTKDDISDLEDDLTEAMEGYTEAVLTADFDGYITELSAQLGDEAAAGQKLFTLVSMENPVIHLTIDELDIPEIIEGLEAEVTVDALVWTNESPVPSTVINRSLSGNAQGGVTTYTVTLELKESVEGLLPGMSGTGTIFISRKSDALYIPLEAVTITDGKSYVWITDKTVSTNTSYDKSNFSDKKNYQAKGSGKAIQKDTSKMTDEQKKDYDDYLKGFEKGEIREDTASDSTVSTLDEYYEGAVMVEVVTGIHNEIQIEVVSGLKEGQIILLPPVYQSESTSADDKNDFNMGAARKAMGGYGK